MYRKSFFSLAPRNLLKSIPFRANAGYFLSFSRPSGNLTSKFSHVFYNTNHAYNHIQSCIEAYQLPKIQDFSPDIKEDWLTHESVRSVVERGILFYHNNDKKKNAICKPVMLCTVRKYDMMHAFITFCIVDHTILIILPLYQETALLHFRRRASVVKYLPDQLVVASS